MTTMWVRYHHCRVALTFARLYFFRRALLVGKLVPPVHVRPTVNGGPTGTMTFELAHLHRCGVERDLVREARRRPMLALAALALEIDRHSDSTDDEHRRSYCGRDGVPHDGDRSTRRSSPRAEAAV